MCFFHVFWELEVIFQGSAGIVQLILFNCSYPYEYAGGHIRGARNLYTKEQIFKEFVDVKQPDENRDGESSRENEASPSKKRNILIFHCEFSSERGPSL